MKILVLGASGMAGHMITLHLKNQRYDVTALTRRPISFCENIVTNIMDEKKIKRVIDEGSYDIIVNCIGILNKECDNDPSTCIYLNSYLPHQIADFVKGTHTKLIHISTDCVFSGKEGLYNESSIKDGDSLYDRSKALGEVIDSHNLTFRTSIIGPDLDQSGIGLFNWFMLENRPIKGFTKAYWTGVTTLTLAKAIDAAIEQNLCGLYNLVNNTIISKYELLQLFNLYMKNSNQVISPCDSVRINKSLVCTRNDFEYVVPTYEVMISEMKNWILEHQEYYPQYKI